MSLFAKAAWIAVLIVFMFVFLPAAMMAAGNVPSNPIKKKMYTVPLYCYESQDEYQQPILVCDAPPKPGAMDH